ncbi:MAG: hypothetical protein IH596_15580 [Bacteroidales bacterium]|nr:hypothetical protein [Bacteroidales bacterium]
MLSRPNVLIVGATTRNTGKTEFACRVIEKFASREEIYGVKVIPVDKDEGDCHRGLEGCGLCNSLTGMYRIIEEVEADTEKDTSRMLRAGVKKAYLLLVDKCSVEQGIHSMLEMLPKNALVVVESNTIRKVLEPGLFIVIREFSTTSVKESCADVIQFADKIVEFNNLSWDFQPDSVLIQRGGWVLA